MSSSNKTENLNLPIFSAQDRPTVLVDWNQQNMAIDAFAGKIVEEAGSAKTHSAKALEDASMALEKANEVHGKAVAADENAKRALKLATEALEVSTNTADLSTLTNEEMLKMKARRIWTNSDPNLSFEPQDIHYSGIDHSIIERSRLVMEYVDDIREAGSMTKIAVLRIGNNEIVEKQTLIDNNNVTHLQLIEEKVNRSIDIEAANDTLTVGVSNANVRRSGVKIKRSNGDIETIPLNIAEDAYKIVPLYITLIPIYGG